MTLDEHTIGVLMDDVMSAHQGDERLIHLLTVRKMIMADRKAHQERIVELETLVANLKVAFRANMLRYAPLGENVDAEIDRVLKEAEKGRLL